MLFFMYSWDLGLMLARHFIKNNGVEVSNWNKRDVMIDLIGKLRCSKSILALKGTRCLY